MKARRPKPPPIRVSEPPRKVTKKTAKKVAKKTAKKTTKRSPRTIELSPPPVEVETSDGTIVKVTVASIKSQAEYRYLFDPDGRGVAWHHETYWKQYVNIHTFNRWAHIDRWAEKREELWSDIEQRTLAHLTDEILAARLSELKEMTENRSAMMEYMTPLRDDDGAIKRHPPGSKYEGLPVFPLELPRMDYFMRAVLEWDRQVMLKRGEAVTRTETLGDGKSRVSVTAIDPVGSLMSVTPEEARNLAKSLMRARFGKQMKEAELLDAEVVEVDGVRDEIGVIKDEEDDL